MSHIFFSDLDIRIHETKKSKAKITRYLANTVHLSQARLLLVTQKVP
jgi:hypothetical protein